ncbi:NADAR family protein [Pseudomonas sp. MAFF212428]|uniref:NADAR family protein n=1 Tax=Pseudomonas brassicae TaxID=2708063 RepID=A0A6B3NPR0_9PSED|nr:NADAR family protein [Pseudomonas brassicae]NER63633.1 NADAR family protein [Pseudomonas brassicae]
MNDSQFVEDLACRYKAGEKFKYVFFWGHQVGKKGLTAACFSQWYTAPFDVDGQRYVSAEHYMMAEKAALFGDQQTRARIIDARGPNAAKALGRQVRGFDEARWAQQRFAIVLRANQAKFAQNAELGAFLRATGERVIVEASPVDRVWGIGLAQDDERASRPDRWRGLNLLGFALMQVREACSG